MTMSSTGRQFYQPVNLPWLNISSPERISAVFEPNELPSSRSPALAGPTGARPGDRRVASREDRHADSDHADDELKPTTRCFGRVVANAALNAQMIFGRVMVCPCRPPQDRQGTRTIRRGGTKPDSLHRLRQKSWIRPRPEPLVSAGPRRKIAVPAMGMLLSAKIA